MEMNLLDGQTVDRGLCFREPAEDAQGQFALFRREAAAPENFLHIG